MSVKKSFSTFKRDELFDQLLNSIDREILGKDPSQISTGQVIIRYEDETDEELEKKVQEVTAKLAEKNRASREKTQKVPILILPLYCKREPNTGESEPPKMESME